MTPIVVIYDALEDLRSSIREGASPLEVLDALRPLLLEVAMSPAILSTDERATLVRRVHSLLRAARLIEGVDLP